MRLSELGELGLLAELENRGSGEEHRRRRGAAPRRARRHTGRARRRGPLPARLDLVARPRLARRSCEPQRPRRFRRRGRRAARHAGRAGRHGPERRARALRGHRGDRRSRCRRRHVEGRQCRAERDRDRQVQARAGPGRARAPETASSSPVRSARQAPRSGGRPTCDLRSGWPRGESSPRVHTRCSTSPTGWPSTRVTSPPAPSCRVVIELDRVPLARGAELADLAFGEDYELLAAVNAAGPYETIGRCEEGEGVAVTLDGEPYELGGWEHFR